MAEFKSLKHGLAICYRCNQKSIRNGAFQMLKIDFRLMLLMQHGHYWAVYPPSMINSEPVTYRDSSEAK